MAGPDAAIPPPRPIAEAVGGTVEFFFVFTFLTCGCNSGHRAMPCLGMQGPLNYKKPPFGVGSSAYDFATSLAWTRPNLSMLLCTCVFL